MKVYEVGTYLWTLSTGNGTLGFILPATAEWKNR